MTKELLSDLREEIKKRDGEIVRLLNERAGISIQVGTIKRSQEMHIYDPLQEREVYRHLVEVNQGPLMDKAIRNIYREIISASRALQEEIRIAYLGPEASYSHLAALSHFGKGAVLCPQPSIYEVFSMVERGKVSLGVVPVENSLEGSVKQALDRLISTPLKIQAEVYLRIQHALLSTRKKMEGIERIYSHPMALGQCRDWLKKNLPNLPLIKTESTSEAMKLIHKDRRGAAIGSPLAASTYGLHILAEGMEDHPLNTTRFLVLGKNQNRPNGQDKTSLLFGTRHMPGALFRALEPFSKAAINLFRIESYPVRDRIWEYLFFVDVSGHEEDESIKKCFGAMEEVTSFLKVLGSYPRGEIPQ